MVVYIGTFPGWHLYHTSSPLEVQSTLSSSCREPSLFTSPFASLRSATGDMGIEFKLVEEYTKELKNGDYKCEPDVTTIENSCRLTCVNSQLDCCTGAIKILCPCCLSDGANTLKDGNTYGINHLYLTSLPSHGHDLREWLYSLEIDK